MPKIAKATIFLSAFLLSACSTVAKTSGNTDTLSNLQQLSAPPPQVETPKDEVSGMRQEALKDMAISLGAQSGLHYRSLQINAFLKENTKTLDQTFNFNPLILPHNVLPPVLSEGRQTLNLNSPDTIRIADQTYQIVSQAKFVTTAPTWRDYLWMDYAQPPVPDSGILPHSEEEKKLWKGLAEKGWKQGIDQANEIYSENLSRLERDYKGMVLYSKLRTQNIVSAPFVATTELGVTGGGENLSVNDQVLKITALPALQPNSARWKPVINKEPQ
jgi:defect in organelle trafficking protein DotC